MNAESLTLFAALATGFTHAFEADHLVAVSSLVTKRRNTFKSIKDGIFWGLGHTSTILIIGLLMIVGKYMISEESFSFLEGLVGFMLVGIGLWRLYQSFQEREHSHDDENGHKVAYSVGLVHGLAGSGVMVFFVLAKMVTAYQGILFLIVFGIGSILGMLVASGLFSLPFSKKIIANKNVHIGLTLFSAILCIVLGGIIINENIL